MLLIIKLIAIHTICKYTTDNPNVFFPILIVGILNNNSNIENIIPITT